MTEKLLEREQVTASSKPCFSEAMPKTVKRQNRNSSAFLGSSPNQSHRIAFCDWKAKFSNEQRSVWANAESLSIFNQILLQQLRSEPAKEHPSIFSAF
jgi:hypothetical protein